MTEKEHELTPEWNVEDYHAEIEGNRLYQKSFAELRKADWYHLSDNWKKPESERDPCDFDIDKKIEEPVAINFYYLRNWRRLYNVMAIVGQTSANRLIRKTTLHGHSIYSHKCGADAVKQLMHMAPGVFSNDPATYEKLDRINCNIDIQHINGKKGTFSVSLFEKTMLGQMAAVLCIPLEKYTTLCQCYSLMTDPELAGHYPDMLDNITKFEERQDFRRENI